jgi:N-succinyldiaminopimelate aminotransferase
VARALNEHGDFPTALAKDLEERRDLLCAGLRDAGLTAFTPDGTYFAMTDVSDLGWDDGTAFCLALPERAGVVAIPAQVFYDHPGAPGAGQHLVRWAFCKERPVIAEGTARLAAADLNA